MRSRAFTIVELLIVLALMAIVVAMATPSMMYGKGRSCEGSAVGALRTISTQEAYFRERDKEEDGNNDYGMLSELSNTGLVDSVLGSGTKQGYYFQAAYSTTSPCFLWFATANPALPGSTGDRYFEVNTAGVIYYTTGRSLAMDTSSCVLPNPQTAAFPIR